MPGFFPSARRAKWQFYWTVTREVHQELSLVYPSPVARRVRFLTNVNDADWSPDGENLAVAHVVGGRDRIEYPIGTVLIRECRPHPTL